MKYAYALRIRSTASNKTLGYYVADDKAPTRKLSSAMHYGAKNRANLEAKIVESTWDAVSVRVVRFSR